MITCFRWQLNFMSGSIILLNGEFWDNFRHDCKLVIITWIILFEWTLLKGSWFDFGFGFLCFWATWDFQSFGLLLVVSLRNGSRLIRTWQRDKKCPSSFTPSLSHHHLPFFFPFAFPSTPPKACVPDCRSRQRGTLHTYWKRWLATSWMWSSTMETTEGLRWERDKGSESLWCLCTACRQE